MKIPATWKGTGLVLLILPQAHALVQGIQDMGLGDALLPVMFALGLGLMLASLKIPSPPLQATAGLLAGFLLWGAVGELGSLLHGGGHGGAHAHGAVGFAPWGLVIIVACGYLVRQPDALRQLVGRGEAGIAPRLGLLVAFEFFLVVWFGHVLLLTAYYHPWFGVRSVFTTAIMLACLAGSAFMLWRTRSADDVAQGIRPGLWIASIFWTGLEVVMKWDWLPKPWLPMKPVTLVALGLLLAGWSFLPVARRGENASAR